MSYNGSGTYVLPTGQPVATNTVISSSVFNAYTADVGNTFNNTLPRDGQASMTGQLKLIDGTSTAPGITFNAEASTGFLRPSTGVLATTILGAEAMRVVSGGRVLMGTTTDDGTSVLQVNGVAKATTFVGALTGAVTGAASLNVLKAGDTMTGNLSLTKAGAVVGLNQPAAGLSGMNFAMSTNNLARWTVGTDNAAESGSNVGTNLLVSRYNDAGAYVDSPIQVTRSTGLTTVGSLTVASALNVSGGATFTGAPTLANAVPLQWKDTGGTARRVAVVNGSTTFLGDVDNLLGGNLHISASAGIITEVNTVAVTTCTATGLGIGTSPTQALEVAGNVIVRDNKAPSTNATSRWFGGAFTGNPMALAVTVGTSGTNSVNIGGGTGSAEPATQVVVTTGAAGVLGAGTERMRIDSSGNVGIGKTAAVRLDVTTSAGQIAQLDSTNASSGYMSFSTSGSNYGFIGSALQIGSGVIGDLAVRGQANLTFATGGSTERMRIDSAGNLLVGTATSFYNSGGRGIIEINGTSQALLGFKVSNAAAGYLFHDGVNLNVLNGLAGALTFATNSAVRMMIDLNGNLGFGTGTSPLFSKLAVASTSSAATTTTNWGTGNSIFGPNVSSSTGAALGLGYNNTLGQAEIISLAPSVAWKPLSLNAGGIYFGATGGAESGRFSVGGNFMLGSTSDNGNKLQVTGSGTVSGTLSAGAFAASGTFTSTSGEGLRVESNGGYISFFDSSNSTRSGYLQGNSASGTIILAAEAAGAIAFTTAGTTRLGISATGVLTDQAGNELGYKGAPQNAQGSSYTLAAGDRGKHVFLTSTGSVSVPPSVFSAGDMVMMVNGTASSTISIVPGSGVTMYQSGTSNTGSRSLLVKGIGTVLCVASNTFHISGNIS